MQRKLLATFAMALAGVVGAAVDASAQCGTTVGNATDGLITQITVDTTWGAAPNPSPICLEEPIYVSGGARLTIVPGTIVRGQPRRGAVGSTDNNPGAVFITAGSQIIADGSPTAPIIMTTAAVDNDDDGVCDNLDSGLGNTFKDPFPGLDPDSPPGCAATGTCTGACTGGCTPLFCDDTPTTAPLAPLDRDGRENVQLWGGLALSGCAPTNLTNEAGAPESNVCSKNGSVDFGNYGVGLLEGVQLPQTPATLAVFGGLEPHDNSGIVRYVSVRHAGDPLVTDNELNGVSLAGVGDGTIYEYVEVYANWDDGHEWFGGTANGNHLVTVYAGDDQFDIDQGHSGSLQYLFTAMPYFAEEGTGGGSYGSGSGDEMVEWDGVDGAAVNSRIDSSDLDTDLTPWPFSQTYIWNMTGIGATQDGAEVTTAPNGDKGGIRIQNGGAGSVLNSIIVNTGPNPCLLTAAGGTNSGYEATDNASNDLIRLVSTTCADTGAPNASAVANGDAVAQREFNGGSQGDNLVTGADVLVQESPDFSPRGNAAGKLDPSILGGLGAYDPRPTGLGIGQGITPAGPSLDRAGTYRGAFEPGADELWTTPWTALNIGGVMAD